MRSNPSAASPQRPMENRPAESSESDSGAVAGSTERPVSGDLSFDGDTATKRVPWTACGASIIPPVRRRLVVEELDDGAVLEDPEACRVYRLNQAALLAWELCDGRRTTREIALEFVRVFDVEFEQALDDVEQVILSLSSQNLLAITSSDG